MPAHRIDAYKDGYKWVLFCVKCGKEEPFESQENCSEQFITSISMLPESLNKKFPLPLDESEKSE